MSATGTLPRARGSALLRRPPLLVFAATLIIVIVIVLACFGPQLAPKDPNAQNLLLGATPPSGEHPLGTDDLGRDVLSRLMCGAGSAVFGPAVIAFGSLLVGSALGLIAGFRGGVLGSLLMRVTDVVYAVPALLVTIVVAGVMGGSYWLAVGLLIVLVSPYDARLVRAAVLEQRGLPYVEAARLLGLPAWRLMLREIWPNVRSIELANAFLNFAFALVGLSALSFLGIGVGPGIADWGTMLAEGRAYLALNEWAAISAGLAISLTAGAVSVLGDRFEEHLYDSGRVR